MLLGRGGSTFRRLFLYFLKGLVLKNTLIAGDILMKLSKSLPFILLVSIAIGIVIGLNINEGLMTALRSVRHIAGQIIFFGVPLIIVASVAPSITRMGKHASKLLGLSLGLSYGSVVLAGLLSMIAGFVIIPNLFIAETVAGRSLPAMIFTLNIPQIMPPMSALALALFLGLSAVWTESKMFTNLLQEFQTMIMTIVRRVIIPLLPIFIGGTFAELAYQGRITEQMPVFLGVIVLIILIHSLWIAILYVIAAIYSKKSPIEVLKHYGPAYITAVGTMSSAATLPIALRSADKSKVLDKGMISFGIPLFAHIHMPGSIISIVFLSLTVSQFLYGTMPQFGTMVMFVFLVAVFAVAAPGVPGGTLMASLGLITAVLGFEEGGAAIAMMLAIFALQDSFGTACNITSDGPMIMNLSKYAEDRGLKLGEGEHSVF